MTNDSTKAILDSFDDPTRARAYGDGPARFVPGFRDLHKMAAVLIQERAPEAAQILVHGAGGGLEIEAFGSLQPQWTFVGVDPAKAMLDAAAERLQNMMDRVTLHQGTIDSAPPGLFDAATSLLTLHFLQAAERVSTVRRIVHRLKPGAPFVVAHTSLQDDPLERERTLDRYQAYAVASGVDPDQAQLARDGVASMAGIVSPEQDLEILRDAGLRDVHSFYSAFAWHGWVGYAP
ncbi:MAG: class I SAM-dependent methyltransferase [Pseudomonadota bacterium]